MEEESSVIKNSRWSTALSGRCRGALTKIIRQIRVLYFVFRHPRTPWYVRVALFFPLGYLCSPIQLIPNFIPVLGQLDDLFVIWCSNRFINRVLDPSILQECTEKTGTADVPAPSENRAPISDAIRLKEMNPT